MSGGTHGNRGIKPHRSSLTENTFHWLVSLHDRSRRKQVKVSGYEGEKVKLVLKVTIANVNTVTYIYNYRYEEKKKGTHNTGKIENSTPECQNCLHRLIINELVALVGMSRRESLIASPMFRPHTDDEVNMRRAVLQANALKEAGG